MKTSGKMGRRQFLKTGAVVAGGCVQTMILGRDTLRPNVSFAGEKQFYQASCGQGDESRMNVLVTYESHLGSTGGIAKAIAEALCRSGAAVEVRMVDQVTDIDRYDAFVIGSAVQKGRWMPHAVDFIRQHQQTLAAKPVAYFLACLALAGAVGQSPKVVAAVTREAESYMAPVLRAVPGIKPVDCGYFAGVLDYGKLSMIEGMVMKAKMRKIGVGEGDYRDWEAIASWGDGLLPRFFRRTPTAA